MKYLTKSDLGVGKSRSIYGVITLTVIALSGFHFVLNDLFLFLRERERKRISKREREKKN
jgi:hypothetical protein